MKFTSEILNQDRAAGCAPRVSISRRQNKRSSRSKKAIFSMTPAMKKQLTVIIAIVALGLIALPIDLNLAIYHWELFPTVHAQELAHAEALSVCNKAIIEIGFLCLIALLVMNTEKRKRRWLIALLVLTLLATAAYVANVTYQDATRYQAQLKDEERWRVENAEREKQNEEIRRAQALEEQKQEEAERAERQGREKEEQKRIAKSYLDRLQEEAQNAETRYAIEYRDLSDENRRMRNNPFWNPHMGEQHLEWLREEAVRAKKTYEEAARLVQGDAQ